MGIIYDNNNNLVIKGDVFEGIDTLKSLGIKVNCIVTSPPYWGLRINSGTEKLWVVNDEQESCSHGLTHNTEPGNRAGMTQVPQTQYPDTDYSGLVPSDPPPVSTQPVNYGENIRARMVPTQSPPVNQGGLPGPTATVGATKEPGGQSSTRRSGKPPTKMATQGMTQHEKWPQGTFSMQKSAPTSPQSPGFQERSKKSGGHGGSTYEPPQEQALREMAGMEIVDQGYWDNRHASVVDDDSLGGTGDNRGHLFSAICTQCGAWWGSLGLEPLLDCGRPNGELCSQCYTCHLVLIWRGLWEILRDDGVCFLNIGDSYIGSNSGSNDYRDERSSISSSHEKYQGQKPGKQPKLKAKDLAGVPGRVAEALQEDGWYRRADIIWVKGTSFSKKGIEELLRPFEESKPLEDFPDWWPELKQTLLDNAYIGNSMPESVKDRPTRGYEMIYMLTKKSKYWADMKAFPDPSNPDGRKDTNYHGAESYQAEESGRPDYIRTRERWPSSAKNPRNVWIFPTAGFGWQLCKNCNSVYDPAQYRKLAKVEVRVNWRQANKDSDYPNAGDGGTHVGGGNLNIQADDFEDGSGTLKRGVCSTCGEHEYWGSHFSSFPKMLPQIAISMGCPPNGIVLDPFSGTGTSIVVARELGMTGIGFEMSEDYCTMMVERLSRLENV